MCPTRKTESDQRLRSSIAEAWHRPEATDELVWLQSLLGLPLALREDLGRLTERIATLSEFDYDWAFTVQQPSLRVGPN